MIILITVLAVTLLVSFLITLVESILLGINSSDVERIKRIDPDAASFWQRLRKNLYHSVTVAVVLDTLVLIFGIALASGLFVSLYGSTYLLVFASVLCIAFIQITEVLPKALGLRHKLVLAQHSASFLSLFVRLLKLLGRPFGGFLDQFNSKILFGDRTITSDISVLAHAAVLDQKISPEQEQLILRSLELSRIHASEIMVKRESMNTVSTSMDLSEALIAAHFHHRTRFPLTLDGDIDRIEGYVNFKDIVGALRLNPDDPTLKGIVRPMVFVLPSTPLSRLLRVLTRGFQHIAVVRDLEGKTLGMVTLEDVIESLVGELEDEYDNPPDLLVKLAENRYRAGGGTSFAKLRARVSTVFPDWDLTIDEWMLGQCGGKMPEEYRAEYEGAQFEVRRLSRGHVFDVIVTAAAQKP